MKGAYRMIALLSLLALALAVSLDSFGVGLTYGLRKMKMPFRSLLFVAGCSACSILIAMAFGTWIQTFLSRQVAESLGGIILILIGAWALYQVFRSPQEEEKQQHSDQVIINLEIKMLGIIIRILRKPTTADIDNSGTITGREAILLGIALSLDAFGAGIGAALIGFSPIWMALSVALMSALFVKFGMKSGFLFADAKWMKKLSFLPGCILILLGIWKV